ncbi:MAG: hypothetical protein ACI92G_003908, partial [Candidatus Pelagisphaera sp.]
VPSSISRARMSWQFFVVSRDVAIGYARYC